MADRAKNTATALDIMKLCKAFDMDTVTLCPDMEDFVEKYCGFVCDLLALTARPVVSVLRDGLLKASPKVSRDLAQQFANRITAAVKFCRVKKKSMTSGQKQSVAVRRICSRLCPDIPASWAASDASLPLAEKSAASSISSQPVAVTAATAASSGAAKKRVVLNKRLLSPSKRRRAILQQYGAQGSPEVEVLSSQDSPASLPAEATAAPAAPARAWFDNRRKTMCGHMADGALAYAKMRPTATGFAEAIFDSGCVMATEIPNLAIAATEAAQSAAAAEEETEPADGKPDGVKKKVTKVTTAKRPAARPKAEVKYEDAVIDQETVKLEGPFKEKSYIRHKDSAGKWRLLVNGTGNKEEFQIMTQVFEWIKANPGCTKQDAKNHKADLMQG